MVADHQRRVENIQMSAKERCRISRPARLYMSRDLQMQSKDRPFFTEPAYDGVDHRDVNEDKHFLGQPVPVA
jgi:hypothetical protein